MKKLNNEKYIRFVIIRSGAYPYLRPVKVSKNDVETQMSSRKMKAYVKEILQKRGVKEDVLPIVIEQVKQKLKSASYKIRLTSLPSEKTTRSKLLDFWLKISIQGRVNILRLDKANRV